MKDSFKAISRMGRGDSCYWTDVVTEHGYFQQRIGELVPRYDKLLNLWYRLRVKAEKGSKLNANCSSRFESKEPKIDPL